MKACATGRHHEHQDPAHAVCPKRIGHRGRHDRCLDEREGRPRTTRIREVPPDCLLRMEPVPPVTKSTATSTLDSWNSRRGRRTVNTGHGAVRTTLAATLPRRVCATAPRPCVPITILRRQRIRICSARCPCARSSGFEKFKRYWSFVSPGVALIRRLSLSPLEREAERRALEARASDSNPLLSTLRLPPAP